MAVEMVILREISSASKCVIVLPSSTRRRRLVAPAVNSNPAVSVVLPESPWPTTPTFRISLLSETFTELLPFLKRNGNTGSGRVAELNWGSQALPHGRGSDPSRDRGALWAGSDLLCPTTIPPRQSEDCSPTHKASSACGPIPTPAARPRRRVSWRAPSSASRPPTRWRYSSALRRRPVPWRSRHRWPCPRRHPQSSELG